MNTNREKSILVTGATGRTGGHVVRFLLERGLPVRALVHRPDARADRLAEMGVEVVTGDLLDLSAVGAATRGVRTAYFVYPIRAGLLEATAIFAQAAAENSVAAVINMSQISARRDALSDAARHHWLAERLLDNAPVPVTHLRPTFFAEWLILFGDYSGPEGVLRIPLGDGRHAPIAGVDQGRVIASILADPEPHAGKTYPLYGPVEMHHSEIAAATARALGRPVRYEPIDVDTFAEGLKARGWSSHVIQHLSSVAIDYRNGIFAGTNDVVETVTGKAPMGVEEFVTLNKESFVGR
ncbi:NmrA family NAD(P)-binding protein [Amycolatopsis sp. NPDC051903]|uniref:NmrA family NAD(P)-binding protein n=1 Tax=Amycolatopsis sp. NPDC051903 TaxID=3363936 RepID=UPI0037BC7FA2